MYGMKTPKDCVLDYISHRNRNYLVFCSGDVRYVNWWSNQKLTDITVIDTIDGVEKLDDIRLIHTCLRMSSEFKSVTPTSLKKKNGAFECYNGARRSSLDLWRHAKFFRPEIDIFTVMRALYYLQEEEKSIASHFCSQVRRRVFWRGNGGYRWAYDEYGLKIEDWKTIGLE